MADKNNNLEGAFNKLKQSIGEKIKDAASLEITTFTGNFKYTVSDIVKSENGKFDIERVLEKLDAQALAELDLLAYTIIKIDGDQANIVRSNLSADEKELLTFHREMIEASQNSRKAIVEMVRSLIPG